MASNVAIIEAVVAELRGRDIPVEFVAGWENRSNGRALSARGLVLHHTVGPNNGEDYPSFGTIMQGNGDTPPPLANFGIGRITGKVIVFAAGATNHAGGGGFNGLVGNSSV